jgi:hypothetical protein
VTRDMGGVDLGEDMTEDETPNLGQQCCCVLGHSVDDVDGVCACSGIITISYVSGNGNTCAYRNADTQTYAYGNADTYTH